MAKSMTGFGRAVHEDNFGTLMVELTSVNSRYLDVIFKTSRSLASYEALVQNRIKARFNRGKITVRIDFRPSASSVQKEFNTDLLKGYYTCLASLAQEVGTTPPDLGTLLSLPGVSDSGANREQGDQEFEECLIQAVDKAADNLTAMRITEGQALIDDIKINLDKWKILIQNIEEQWKKLSEGAFEAFRERVTTVVERLGVTVDQGRLAQELAIIADKWDISEEISRSQSHISQFEKLIPLQTPVGRKMDFLLQEMNREVNTMGSKSASTDLRWLVVDGKTLLERIREQVQNVE